MVVKYFEGTNGFRKNDLFQTFSFYMYFSKYETELKEMCNSKNFDFFLFPLSLCITRLVQRLRLRSTTSMLRVTPEVNEVWRHRSCRSPALRQCCQINIQVPNSYWKSDLHLLFLDVKVLVFHTCKAKIKKEKFVDISVLSNCSSPPTTGISLSRPSLADPASERHERLVRRTSAVGKWNKSLTFRFVDLQLPDQSQLVGIRLMNL